MIRFERYQRGNWIAPFGDDNPLFQTNLSDPFASIEVQITNGDFLHVHNVHIKVRSVKKGHLGQSFQESLPISIVFRSLSLGTFTSYPTCPFVFTGVLTDRWRPT